MMVERTGYAAVGICISPTMTLGMHEGVLMQLWQGSDGSCRWKRIQEIDDNFPRRKKDERPNPINNDTCDQ